MNKIKTTEATAREETVGAATPIASGPGPGTMVSFGWAVTALEEGKRVQRKGWNGSGLYVFRQVPSTVPEEIVPKMSSLPQAVKSDFIKRGGVLEYHSQLAIVYPMEDGATKIFGWAPSTSDALATDWVILD